MQSFTCYLINLDKDKDRLVFMENQLQTCGINYIRIPAFYGKNIPEEEKQFQFKKRHLGKLTDGELGCALSHQEGYKRIVTENNAYTLILEDDVLLPQNFKEVIEAEIKKNKELPSWEYLSFDYFAYGFSFLALWVPGIRKMLKQEKKGSKKTWLTLTSCLKFIPLIAFVILEQLQVYTTKNNAITPLKSTSFAGAYILTTVGAQKLLSVSKTHLYIADRLPAMTRKKEKLLFKIYTPLIVRQLKETFTSNLDLSQ